MGDRLYPASIKRSKKVRLDHYDSDADDEMYQDNRHFLGRQGHTFRRIGCKSSNTKAPSLEHGRIIKTATVPVTKIDEIFEFRINPLQSRCEGTPLRTFEIQEQVVEALEEFCVAKNTVYKHWENTCHTIYEIPVIGYIFNENYQAKSVSTKDWLYYAGKLWDPSILYLYRDGVDNMKSQLRPLCPVANCEAYNERIRVGNIELDDGNILNRAGAWSYSEQTNPDYISKRQQKKLRKAQNHHPHREYLEIDLGHLHEITHVGTLGGYPRWKDVHTFPPSGNDDSGIRAYPVRCRRRNDPYVFITREESLGWITDYSIQYRHPATRKWCDYSQRFAGNINIRDEVVHAVSLQARYLRITPRAYHQHMDFTALIYGQKIDLQVRGDSSKRSRGREVKEWQQYGHDDSLSEETNTSNRRRDRAEVQKMETVTYVLKPNQFSPFRTDGNGCINWNCWDIESQWRKRETLRRAIVEDRENHLA